MAGQKAERDEFRQDIGAAAVVGYRRNTDWLEGAAVDVLALSALAESRARAAANDPKQVLEKVKTNYPDLSRATGFEVA